MLILRIKISTSTYHTCIFYFILFYCVYKNSVGVTYLPHNNLYQFVSSIFTTPKHSLNFCHSHFNNSSLISSFIIVLLYPLVVLWYNSLPMLSNNCFLHFFFIFFVWCFPGLIVLTLIEKWILTDDLIYISIFLSKEHYFNCFFSWLQVYILVWTRWKLISSTSKK